MPQGQRWRATTEAEAKRRHLTIIGRAIRTLDPDAFVRLAPRLDGSDLLSLAWRPLPLSFDRPDGGRIYVSLEQALDVGPHPDYHREFKMNTRSYYYGVYDVPETDSADPIVAWHWDPADENGWTYPHLHAPVDDPLERGARLHLPTGQRITIEQVLRFLIAEELAVPAVSDEEWRAVLDDGQHRYEQYQTQDPRSDQRSN